MFNCNTSSAWEVVCKKRFPRVLAPYSTIFLLSRHKALHQICFAKTLYNAQLNLHYTQYNIHKTYLHTACFKIGRQSLKKWNWVGDAKRGRFRRPKSSFSLQPMLGLQIWKNIFKFPKWKWVGEAPEKRLQASAIFISSAQAPRGHSTTNQLSEVRYRFAHLPFLLFLQPHSIVFNGWPWVFAQVGSIQ